MSDRAYAKVQGQQKTSSGPSPTRSLLQRTCACGQHTIVGGECEECRSKQSRLLRSQRAFEPPSAPVAVQGNAPAQETIPSFNSVNGGVSCFGHDFSRIPIRSMQTSVAQTKLKVNRPGDVSEKEADHVAEQVMRMTDRGPSVSEDEDEANTSLMRKPGSEPQAETGAHISTVPFVVQDVLRSPGQTLDASARAFMESRFGYDFSGVRVHADERAAASARAVHALAYTVGRDVVFGVGQYAPGTIAGKRLLAHELVHTIQQQTAPATVGIFRTPAPIPGWNFTPADYVKLTSAGEALTIAPDSSFFPAKLKENLKNTLAYVLGPKISPPATEGVNALDFFHGHLVVKKDPKVKAREMTGPAGAAYKKGEKFSDELNAIKAKALGGVISPSGTVSFPKAPKGYPLDPSDPLTPSKLSAFKKSVEDVLPSFEKLLDEGSKLPGAAMMYHTFELKLPSDFKGVKPPSWYDNPRRNYITPLDTNKPTPYTLPKSLSEAGKNYQDEYPIIASFSFLVDDKGAIHIRPFNTAANLTSLDLSTITGKPFPGEPFPIP